MDPVVVNGRNLEREPAQKSRKRPDEIRDRAAPLLAGEPTIDMLTGGGGYDISDRVSAGLDLNIYRNQGTFALDWTQVAVVGEFRSPTSYTLRLAYQRNQYDEREFDFDDYGSNIVTVSMGYRF